MDKKQARKILLEGLTKPDFARLEYYKLEQQKSGYSMLAFVGFLSEVISDYLQRFKGNWFDKMGNEREPVSGLPLVLDLGYSPKEIHQSATDFMGSPQININTLEFLNSEIEKLIPLTKKENQIKPKHQLSSRVQSALYLYYTKKTLEKKDPLYNTLNEWSKEDRRIKTNGSLKRYNINKQHLEAMKTRLHSEKKYTEKVKCENDINKLTENWNKKIPE